MLLRWRCCFLKMLLHMLSNCFVDVKRKNLMRILPMVLCWIMTFLCQSKETWFLFKKKKKRNYCGIHKNNIRWITKKNRYTFKQRTTYPRYVVRMLNGFLVFSSCGKNTKHSERWHFSKLKTMSLNCLPGNLKPLPYIYIYMYTYHPYILGQQTGWVGKSSWIIVCDFNKNIYWAAKKLFFCRVSKIGNVIHHTISITSTKGMKVKVWSCCIQASCVWLSLYL